MWTSLLQKLWDKGVDIAAGVITSVLSAVLIAIIGYVFYAVKRKRDLQLEEEKQRQHDRIDRELQEVRAGEQQKSNNIRLRQRISGFIGQAKAAVDDRIRQGKLWNEYIKFLSDEKLNTLPRNLKTISTRLNWAKGLEHSQDATTTALNS